MKDDMQEMTDETMMDLLRMVATDYRNKGSELIAKICDESARRIDLFQHRIAEAKTSDADRIDRTAYRAGWTDGYEAGYVDCDDSQPMISDCPLGPLEETA